MKKLKKLCSLLVALMMCASLAACGGSDDAQLKKLTEAYNQVAPLYNEAAAAAEENGWLADEQTAIELEALSATLSYIGSGLTEDSSKLEDADINGLIEQLEGLRPAVEELVQRVSVPYGDEG